MTKVTTIVTDGMPGAHFFDHYRHVPTDPDWWPWPHFLPREIACHADGSLLVVPAALDALEDMRRRWGGPLIVVSGYRSAEHNRAVGGAPGSKHMSGIAFDISCRLSQQDDLIEAACQAGFRGIGRYDHWIHVDLGPARHWDKRSRK
jgi:zinc D-Ala-D-Ala carboxypeptidase